MNNTIYNKFSTMPYIPYNIIAFLAKSPKAENLWKILAYNTYDCLAKPNLTLKEKMNLIWNGQDRQENYNIFLTYLVGNMQIEAKTILKLFQYDVAPINKNISTVTYEFDILIGQKTAMIDYYGIPCNRAEVFESELLRILNGTDIGGVGLLSFDMQLSRSARTYFNIGNNSTFTGISLIMAIQVSDNSDEEC